MCNFIDYDRLRHLYIQKSRLVFTFQLSFFALSCYVLNPMFTIFFFFNSTILSNLIYSFSNSFSTQSFLYSYFFSHFFASFFSLTFITFKNLNSNTTIFLFASKFTSYLLLIWACHLISYLSSSLTSFFLAFFYLQYFVYKYPTIYSIFLYHQH